MPMTVQQLLSFDDHRPGDKVLIRSGLEKGKRAVVLSASNGVLKVQIDEGHVVEVTLDAITNYSRSARRAWQNMPKRAGRPKSSVARKKMVSIRIESDVWERLGQAAAEGLIPSRELMINMWLRHHLEELLGEG